MADTKPLYVVRMSIPGYWEQPWQVVTHTIYVELMTRECIEAPFGMIQLRDFRSTTVEGRAIYTEGQIKEWDQNLKALWAAHLGEPIEDTSLAAA